MRDCGDFVAIPDLASLERVLDSGGEEAIVLFNHDPGCPVSGWAYQELVDLGRQVFLVDVRRAHDVKRAISQRTGIRHESPQVIVLRQGRVIWSASHGRITAEALDRALGSDDSGGDSRSTQPVER